MRFLYIAIAIVVSSVFAKAASGTESLSLSELINVALEENEQIKSQEYELKAEKSLIYSASGLDSPVLGISTLDRGARTQYITISQKIKFPSKYFLRSDAQAAVAKGAEAYLRAARLDLKSKIAKLYYSIYAVQKELQLAKANIDSVREFARVAEKKYAAGKSSQSDSMKAHFELTQLELEVIRLEQEEEALHEKLRAALNKPDFKKMNLAQQELNPPIFYEDRIRLSGAQPEAFLATHSPALQAASYKLEEAKLHSKLVQWEYVPDFQIQYQHRIAGEPSESSIFSVGISVPLWFWNQYSNASAASSRKQARQYNFNHLSLELTAQARDLLGKVKTGLKTIKIYKTSLIPQAQGTYNSSRSAYQANRTSFLDLLDSERSLYRVKTGYYKSLSQYVMYLSQLESLIGIEVSDLGKTQRGEL